LNQELELFIPGYSLGCDLEWINPALNQFLPYLPNLLRRGHNDPQQCVAEMLLVREMCRQL
jgi:hypothetical protein